jgi:molybdopterin-containing oxidoreductase family iron-sulfur binding subunit
MHAGYSGTNKGFNANVVRVSKALWVASGGKITKTGDDYPLACTQYHFNMEGRKILSAGTLEEYKKNPAFCHEGDETPPQNDSLYKEYAYPGYAWGMAIDLKNCNGCNACVVACGSENNIAIVGKDQVMRGREMHWIRIDRYYSGDPETPETYFQPVACVQCEDAPCEIVCPVAATETDAEGLNNMVYNRCVGTRYCSNNCPYKVRRFNFLLFSDFETESLKLMRNPDVSVRSRGVMEKCSYCVQRIQEAKIRSDKENRSINDGEIVTACQQACPAKAITFGNINDKNSKVSKLRAQQRNYQVIADINTRPRTTYVAGVLNLNQELETTPVEHDPAKG